MQRSERGIDQLAILRRLAEVEERRFKVFEQFGDFLAKRGPEVSEALLSVTDARAKDSTRAPIRKAYNTVRPSGVKNVEGALPRLGALVQKYAG